jgi:L-ascorbate metabolism protein UlaG (beta-lactamase superfamily)
MADTVSIVCGRTDLPNLSHSHFDHVGDVSKLPPSTRLFVGPGTLKNALPGYPADNNSWNLASDFM